MKATIKVYKQGRQRALYVRCGEGEDILSQVAAVIEDVLHGASGEFTEASELEARKICAIKVRFNP